MLKPPTSEQVADLPACASILERFFCSTGLELTNETTTRPLEPYSSLTKGSSERRTGYTTNPSMDVVRHFKTTFLFLGFRLRLAALITRRKASDPYSKRL